MADNYLDISVKSSLIKSISPTSTTMTKLDLVASNYRYVYKGYSEGEINLEPNVLDYPLSLDSKFILINSDKYIDVSLSDGLGNVNSLDKVKFFSFESEDGLTVKISNASTEVAKVKYVMIEL